MVAIANGRAILVMMTMSGLANTMSRTMNGIHGGITVNYMVMIGSVLII